MKRVLAPAGAPLETLWHDSNLGAVAAFLDANVGGCGWVDTAVASGTLRPIACAAPRGRRVSEAPPITDACRDVIAATAGGLPVARAVTTTARDPASR